MNGRHRWRRLVIYFDLLLHPPLLLSSLPPHRKPSRWISAFPTRNISILFGRVSFLALPLWASWVVVIHPQCLRAAASLLAGRTSACWLSGFLFSLEPNSKDPFKPFNFFFPFLSFNDLFWALKATLHNLFTKLILAGSGSVLLRLRSSTQLLTAHVNTACDCAH